jgi:hypothetical protein
MAGAPPAEIQQENPPAPAHPFTSAAVVLSEPRISYLLMRLPLFKKIPADSLLQFLIMYCFALMYIVLVADLVAVLFAIGVFLPLAAVGYAIYRFFALVSPGQKLVTTAAVGGVLAKAFVIPLVWSFFKSAAWKKIKE